MYNLRICKIIVFPYISGQLAVPLSNCQCSSGNGFPFLFPATKESSHHWLLSLEKVFLLMGCSKNYIMYWGVYECYYSITSEISVHKVHKNDYLILCIFTFVFLHSFFSTITFYKICGQVLHYC